MELLLLTFLWLILPISQTGPDAPPPQIPRAEGPPAATSQALSAAPDNLTAKELNDHLALLIGNNTPQARRMGAEKLLKARSPDALQALAQVLRGRAPAPLSASASTESGRGASPPSAPDLAAQIAVCEAIAQDERPEPALIEPLMTLLGDERQGLSEAARSGLLQFDPLVVVSQLAPIAAEDSADLDRRLAAIAALGALGDRPEAAAALLDLLKESSPTVRTAALASLQRITGVETPDEAAVRSWWDTHGSMRPEEWLLVRSRVRGKEIRQLRGDSAALTARLVSAYRDAYFNLLEADRPRRLEAFLSDPVPAVRQLGLDLINGLITDRKDKDIGPEARRRLVELLSDPSPAVRLQASRMVGDLRPPSATGELLRCLTVEADRFVRGAQVRALGLIEDPKAIPVLIERLGDDVPAVRSESATALARCARRADVSRSDSEAVGKALEGHFSALPRSDEDSREVLLAAMALLADPGFRPLYERELRGGGSVKIRRAAINGLASYGDLAAADALLPFLTAPEVDIRFAAADGLGKCGRRRSDLRGLEPLLSPTSEPDKSVRDRAWESFVKIVEQLPTEEQVQVSDQFDVADDKPMQRRRLDLLKALLLDSGRNSQGRPANAGGKEPLSHEVRDQLLTRLADCQWKLDEYAAAAASLEQAIDAADPHNTNRIYDLSIRCIAARLKAHEDAAALARLKQLCESNPAKSDAAKPIQPVLDEVRNRLQAAPDGNAFAELLRLIDNCSDVLGACRTQFEPQLVALRKEAIERRDAAMDALFSELSPDAESKLLTFSRDLILPRLCQRLSTAAPTTGPARRAEESLERFGRRLVPTWPGLPAGATMENRRAAIQNLIDLARTAGAVRAPATSQQTSRAPQKASAKTAGANRA